MIYIRQDGKKIDHPIHLPLIARGKDRKRLKDQSIERLVRLGMTPENAKKALKRT